MSPRWRRGAAFLAVALARPLAANAAESPLAAKVEDDLLEMQAFGGLGFLDDKYAHVAYHFSSFRQGTRRWGEGELWLSLDGPAPRVRLKGYAYSPRFGHGEITLVLDSGRGLMYALLKLGELREAQCMSFPFPRSDKNSAERLRRLRWRQQQVAQHWTVEEVDGPGPAAPRQTKPSEVLAVNWTKSYTLDVLISDAPGRVQEVDLREGSRIVKTVRIKDVLANGDGPPVRGGVAGTEEDIFAMPYENCTPVDEVKDPLLLVEIKPPNKKSSALGDLLLALADRAAGGNWPRSFLALCAIVVPGDVAVMIEEPPPPDLSALDGLSFDYTAKVYRLAGNVSFDDPAADLQDEDGSSHRSSGVLTLDLAGRSLRLHGEEQETKVGPVITDLLAHALGAEPKVWANVKLPAQGEQHCGVYGFPPGVGAGASSAAALELSSRHELKFIGIDTIDDEDCGIFATTLPRGRRIYIWVDMEGDRPGQFLRAEVRKDAQRLRRVDVSHWHTEEMTQVQALPAKEWNCTGSFAGDPFVHLGLRSLESWSIELQDALRSLRELPRPFAVLEMLALAGDVCLMVKEPSPPQLWRLPGLSFGYTLFLGGAPEGASTELWVGQGPYTMGRAAVDHMQSRFRISANAFSEDDGKSSAINISLAFAEGTLAVRVRRGFDDRCLSLTPKRFDVAFTPPAAGVFDGVEKLGDAECDRFTFPGSQTHADTSVRFWLSREDAADQKDAATGEPGPVGGRVCQLQVSAGPGVSPASSSDAGKSALLYFSDWEEAYHPDPEDATEWGCLPVTDVVAPWIELAADPMPMEERLSSPELWPAATALGRLIEAFTVLGVFPSRWIDHVMSRLIIRPPPKLITTTTPAPVHILSPDLKTMAFSFRSTYIEGDEPFQRNHKPVHPMGVTHEGHGEIRANFEHRHFYMRSVAQNISRGIPWLESEVVWNSGQKRLWIRTSLKAEGYERCWSVHMHRQPPLSGSRNPFLYHIKNGMGKEVHDASRRGMDRFIIYLDLWTVAELYTDANSALSAIHFKDTTDPAQSSSVGIMVYDFTTHAHHRGGGPMEPGAGWNCEQVERLEGGDHIMAWDVMRLLFPEA